MFYVAKQYYKTSFFFFHIPEIGSYTPLLSFASIILYCNLLMFAFSATYYRVSINILELIQKSIFSFENGKQLNIFSSILFIKGFYAHCPQEDYLG